MRDRRRTRSIESGPQVHELGGPVPARRVSDLPRGPVGGFVDLDGERWYRIRDVDRMAPFFMNLPTDTDLWMFISSTGGLTAGRRDADGALFPYETVDRLHDGHLHTGPVTLLRVASAGQTPLLWEPFRAPGEPSDAVERSLAKNVIGNRLLFEERHVASGLTFRYRWAGSDATGWVRTCTLVHEGRGPVTIELLDGLRNVLPGAVAVELTQQASCLVDAYKRADLDPATGLAMYSLTARVSDGPEPAEVLRANTVWCHGLPSPTLALSADALGAFRRGAPVTGDTVLTGQRGCFLAHARVTLRPGERLEWHVVADAARSHVDVARLRALLRHREDLGLWIEQSLREASAGLERIVASSDGMQLTGREEVAVHHFANVMFNDLRGGVFLHDHLVPADDLRDFVRTRDRALAERHAACLDALPPELEVTHLHQCLDATGDPDLRRIGLEYLPLYFSRRHGDPSRPWNRFSIRVRDAEGHRALRFEGNWRDIFQNWEALTRSFPAFLPGVIARFVDASTVDGFNPYRITRDGIDWEVLDPDDPWSGIGYWGDHQIVYLLRLLESLRAHQPGRLEALLSERIFAFVEVPYRLRPYAEMLREPRATIRYDADQAARVNARVAARGYDGQLLTDADGGVLHVSLLEKLLVPALAKLSCLVPDGGIWMNTQRPEWNDANNALVGDGLSVVTACHLRRYLVFLEHLLGADAPARAPVTHEVVAWLRRTVGLLEGARASLTAPCVDDTARRALMDGLGEAFSVYRDQVQRPRTARALEFDTGEVRAWCRLAVEHLDHTIRANRRADGLYHAYHLLDADPAGDRAAVHPLGLMLEGQVAALGSGLVGADEAVRLLDALHASALHRADQDTFLLYPDRALPSFLERNRVPDEAAAEVPLVRRMLAAGVDTVLERDADGVLRFHGDLANARDLSAALDRLAARDGWAAPVEQDRRALSELFVRVFEHRTYTGRSGRMHAYEGLGSIYWHMVAKLLLAVQELALAADDDGTPAATRAALARAYHRVRRGLGFEKSVSEYGAFPTDPYSHTPAHVGAQQPGMTGQVKEEILTRFGELGVRVEDGCARFAPTLLERNEFLSQPALYRFHDLAGAERSLPLAAGQLAFTYCQVPVVYTLVEGPAWVRLTLDDDRVLERAGDRLEADDSRLLWSREGGLRRLDVGVTASRLAD
jgi:hypothetical protein